MLPCARRLRLLLIAVLLALSPAAFAKGPIHSATWDVYFSPGGGAEGAVVRALAEARGTVYVQAYSFTNAAIAKALVDAHKRGVVVEVILDKSTQTARYSAATFTSNAGIPTAIDAKHAIAHNKIMIIDNATVLTGSYNFTKAAEHSNAENLIVLRDPDLAARYMANWKVHRAHAALLSAH